MRKQRINSAPIRFATIFLAIALIGVALVGFVQARDELEIREVKGHAVPLQFMVKEGVSQVPGVIIAHGFGTSRQFMLGFGYTLARAGYGVMLLDFSGHAANREPLDADSAALQRDLDAAFSGLVAQTEIDADRIGLIGHSMGAGAVMTAAIRDVDRYGATIAVSPTSAEVSHEAPRNLLLQGGSLEPRFLEKAKDLLAQAGGESGEFDAGRARSLLVVPGAEHILVVFKHEAHQAALDWLNQSFAEEFSTGYRDRRLLLYGLNILGWMLLFIGIRPRVHVASLDPAASIRQPWNWVQVILAPLVASAVIALVNILWPVNSLGGIAVGGALALWFLAMGLIWLIPGFRPSRPTRRDFALGFCLFALLWVGIGLVAQWVWLNWLLVPARLARWPIVSIAFLPWLLAAGQAQEGETAANRAAWWLAQTVSVMVGLILLVVLVPSLGVIILALPVLPPLMAIMSVAGSSFNAAWPYAIGNAMFFGWQIMAYFPMVA